MQDQDKTKDQLIGEMKKMRLEIAEFRASEAIRQDSEKLLGEAALKFREFVDKAGEAIFIVQNGEIKFSNPAALCFMTDATERKQVESALCESEPGKGAEFKVYFPAIESEPTNRRRTSPSAHLTVTETILVVEDTLPVAELAHRILTNAGYSVIFANNGRNAVAIYQTRTSEISLVILDLLMPVMSCRDCLMELLRIDPSVQVLIANGYAPDDNLHREIGPLVKGFLHKPFAIAELLNEVGSVLGGD